MAEIRQREREKINGLSVLIIENVRNSKGKSTDGQKAIFFLTEMYLTSAIEKIASTSERITREKVICSELILFRSSHHH